MVWPDATAIIVITLIAIRAILEGVFGLIQIVQLRKVLRGEWLLVVRSLVALILGVWMLLQPLVGGLALLILIGIYAIVVGITQVIEAFRFRGAMVAD